MTKEQKNTYQAFAVKCIKNKTPVKFRTGTYLCKNIVFGVSEVNNEDFLAVILADVERKRTSIQIDLEEFYITNHSKEDTKIE